MIWPFSRRRPRVMLVSKEDCPLCDEAREALEAALRAVPAELETRKLEDDPALAAAHRDEVPVVFIDGAKRFFGRVEPRSLLRALRIAARRAP